MLSESRAIKTLQAFVWFLFFFAFEMVDSFQSHASSKLSWQMINNPVSRALSSFYLGGTDSIFGLGLAYGLNLF